MTRPSAEIFVSVVQQAPAGSGRSSRTRPGAGCSRSRPGRTAGSCRHRPGGCPRHRRRASARRAAWCSRATAGPAASRRARSGAGPAAAARRAAGRRWRTASPPSACRPRERAPASSSTSRPSRRTAPRGGICAATPGACEMGSGHPLQPRERDLVAEVRVLDLDAVDRRGAGPSLGSAQHDRRPPVAHLLAGPIRPRRLAEPRDAARGCVTSARQRSRNTCFAGRLR